MNRFLGMPGLRRLALAWMVVLLDLGAGSAGMPPPFPAGPAGPLLPAFSCSIRVPKPEPLDLTSVAKISAEQAMAAAREAYPGSQAQRVELENDHGCLIYFVSLSNGLEVKVDAGTGVVLPPDQEDSEDEGQERAWSK